MHSATLPSPATAAVELTQLKPLMGASIRYGFASVTHFHSEWGFHYIYLEPGTVDDHERARRPRYI